MGLFSGFFTSDDDRKRDEARRQRRAINKAEDAIDTVDSTIAELRKDELKEWENAKKAAAAGRKADAMLALQRFRQFEVHIYQLEKRKWVFENYLNRLKMSTINDVFRDAMEALNDAIQVDVDMVTDSIEDINDKLTDVTALDKEWEKNFQKNINGMSVQETDIIPDIDALFQAVQGEVAINIGGGAKDVAQTRPTINDVQAKADAILNTSAEK
ncbi:MAG: Snf7 family protein [Thermoguttaceae bacterium]|nr:Snf7 family protein [Thermoguttaceae bacterium]